mmetsp:Transcript_9285/g.37566  ORF Transcript_9285/g.37566 Transcript_9285/m.37566 type:complete len:434 (+) Transcript_9285:533-1834(+)
MRGAARHRVEVAANHHGNLRRRRDLLQALEQGVDLPEFHVVELGVGVDVGVRHAEQLTLTLRRLDAGLLQRLEHDDQRDVVLHQPVERVLLLGGPAERLHQRERRFVELHLVLLDQREPVLLEKDGAPVDDVRALAEHLRRLLLVHRGVASLGELPGEEVLEVVALHLLQTEDVRVVHDDLLEDVLPPVVPAQRPLRRVPVHLARGVEIREDVVREHRESPALAPVVSRDGHQVTPRRRRRRDDSAGGERLGRAAPGAGGGIHRDDLKLEQVPDVVHRGAVPLLPAHLRPRLRLILSDVLRFDVPRGPVRLVMAGLGVEVVTRAVRGRVVRLVLQVGRPPQRVALLLVQTLGYAVAHPLPPRLCEALLVAVVRLAVDVLQHRGFAGVDAAHRSLPVRSAAVPPVPQVGAVRGIRLRDVGGGRRAVPLARHDVR